MTAFAFLGVLAALCAALFVICYVIGVLARLGSAILTFLFPPKPNP